MRKRSRNNGNNELPIVVRRKITVSKTSPAKSLAPAAYNTTRPLVTKNEERNIKNRNNRGAQWTKQFHRNKSNSAHISKFTLPNGTKPAYHGLSEIPFTRHNVRRQHQRLNQQVKSGVPVSTGKFGNRPPLSSPKNGGKKKKKSKKKKTTKAYKVIDKQEKKAKKEIKKLKSERAKLKKKIKVAEKKKKAATTKRKKVSKK